MMTELEQGRTYRRDELSPSDWAAHVAEVREGDRIEYWMSNHGSRQEARRVHRLGTVDEFTVLSLVPRVPRDPEWAGARVVIDRDGSPWLRMADGRYTLGAGAVPRPATVWLRTQNDRYTLGAGAVPRPATVWLRTQNDRYAESDSSPCPAADVEACEGPCHVLIDADGRVPVETVMHMNGVSWLDLLGAVASQPFFATRNIAESVMDALGGSDE